MGNGHGDEAPEPRQSLFSWAEFIVDEPVKPKGRDPEAPARSRVTVGVGAQSRTGMSSGAGRRRS